jgi:hypothetical protein
LIHSFCHFGSLLPVVFRALGIRFFFYSNEGSPLEQMHVHANRGAAEAKVWIEPEVAIGASSGFSPGELRDILKAIRGRRALIESVWNDHFRR